MTEKSPLTILGLADAGEVNNATSPLYLSPVSAGFPSAAEDYIDSQINLHELLVRNPAHHFFSTSCRKFGILVAVHPSCPRVAVVLHFQLYWIEGG